VAGELQADRFRIRLLRICIYVLFCWLLCEKLNISRGDKGVECVLNKQAQLLRSGAREAEQSIRGVEDASSLGICDRATARSVHAVAVRIIESTTGGSSDTLDILAAGEKHMLPIIFRGKTVNAPRERVRALTDRSHSPHTDIYQGLQTDAQRNAACALSTKYARTKRMMRVFDK